MNDETKELIKELKEYRDGMVARNLPFQWISDIITKWEMKKDFLEEAEKEKKELNESYKESVRQAKERKVKTTSEQLQDELEPIRDTSKDPFKGTSIEGKD